MTEKREVSGTQVLQRAAEILRIVALRNQRGVRLTEIAATLHLQLPTAHRLLRGLVDERMLARSDESKLYSLGPGLYELGLTASTRFDLLDFFQPAISRIIDITQDTVVLTVRSGSDGVCIERRTGAFPIKIYTVTRGTRRPLSSGAGGLAILSALSDDEARRIIATNAAQLRGYPNKSEGEISRQVQDARRAGYAFNRLAQTHPRIAALGVPVCNSYGAPAAGLSVIALAARLAGKRRDEIVSLLKKEADRVSLNLRSMTTSDSGRKAAFAKRSTSESRRRSAPANIG